MLHNIDKKEHTQSSKLLQQGEAAPDFTLPIASEQKVSLSDFRGQPVILAFYPADWSPVCGDQMSLYNEILPEFQRYNAQLLGISVDGVWSHIAFTKAKNLQFPLLADFEPKGEVARKYGAYSDSGTTERALFVIDEDGVIRWSYLSPKKVNPGADGILSALDALEPAQDSNEDPPQLTLPVGERDHIQGPATAPITLVEYGDYQCPDCGVAYPIIKELQKRFRGQLRFAFRNFPLTQMHPHAEHAARMAEIAGDHDRFWEMHDLLYEHQEALDDTHLLHYATQLGLDSTACQRELADPKYGHRIEEDVNSGIKSGVNGTPSFYINGERYDDSYDIETFSETIQQILADTESK